MTITRSRDCFRPEIELRLAELLTEYLVTSIDGETMETRLTIFAVLRLLLTALITAVACSSAAGPNDAQAAAAATQGLINSLRLGSISSQEIAKLILEDRFEEFEQKIAEYEAGLQRDVSYEYPLLKSIAIPGSRADLLPHLDEWVRTRPSYISYSARGWYRVNRGFFLRGSAFIKDTPQQQLDKMIEMNKIGRGDLLRAMELNAKFVPAYAGLVRIERASGSRQVAAAIVNKATREVPNTFYVRFEYMESLYPRWGGNYEEMEAYAQSQLWAVSLNPRIWSLQGEVHGERGFNAWQSKDYSAAIRYYTQALAYGDRMEFLHRRATLLAWSRQTDKFKQDIDRMIAVDPTFDRIPQHAACLEELMAEHPCSFKQ